MAQHSEDVAARYPAPSVRAGGRPFTIAAFVCAGLGVLFGLLAALAGVVLGIIGHVKGDRPLGAWSIGASVLGGIVGMVLAAAILSSSDNETTGLLLGSFL